MEEDLVARGRVLRLRTRGRVSGLPASATIGFVERPDGTLAVSAGSPRADWAQNLLHDPACHVTIAGDQFEAVADEVTGSEHAAAVRDLILKYGQPAETLGAGPSFLLQRVER